MASSTLGDLSRRWHLPTWKLRRAADALNPPLPRAGGYRLVPQERLDELRAALRRFGYLDDAAPTNHQEIGHVG